MHTLQKISIYAIVVVSIFALTEYQALAGAKNQYADVIYHNGKIYTVDEQRSWAEAVAIKDGKFLAVGSSAEVLALAGPETGRYDLGGSMAMPGLHDGHLHTFALTNFLDCTMPWFKPEQLREVLEHCKTCRVKGYPWLIINGMEMWHSTDIDNSLLNEIFPDIPVVIRDVSKHTYLLNAKALEIAGITKDTPQPEGGVIGKNPETGEPTGMLAEFSAIGLVQHHIPPYTPDLLEQGYANLLQELLKHGVTSIQEAGMMTEEMFQILSRFEQQGKPFPYIMCHLVWTHAGDDRAREEEMIRNRARYETQHVSTKGIKLFLDGVPVPPAFTHVPLGPDGEVDETNLLIPRDVLAEKIGEWDKAELKVKMHASADGAIRVGLDAIEAVRKANGYSGIRHEIAHTPNVSPPDLPRFAELKAIAEVSPYFWHLGDSSLGGSGYQFRSLYDNGALITIGSDYPVVDSFNPFPPLQGIVVRKGESVPIEVAIEFFTRNAAKANLRLEEMGSIEVGKIANMIVLDRNLLEIPSSEIGHTKVLKTILDGKLVYEMQ